MANEFYLDVDKSTNNWTFSLRLRTYPEQLGKQIATFNPHARFNHSNIMEKIVQLLNDNIEEIL